MIAQTPSVDSSVLWHSAYNGSDCCTLRANGQVLECVYAFTTSLILDDLLNSPGADPWRSLSRHFASLLLTPRGVGLPFLASVCS